MVTRRQLNKSIRQSKLESPAKITSSRIVSGFIVAAIDLSVQASGCPRDCRRGYFLRNSTRPVPQPGRSVLAPHKAARKRRAKAASPAAVPIWTGTASKLTLQPPTCFIVPAPLIALSAWPLQPHPLERPFRCGRRPETIK